MSVHTVAYSIGAGKRSNEIKDSSHYVPGPGSYTGDTKRRIPNPSWKIGNAKRKDLSNTDGVPGPGNYHNDLKSNFPKYSISKKYAEKGEKIQPGPGSYNPDNKFHSKVKHYPKFTFGSKYDSTSTSTNDHPGPGMYDINSNNCIGRPKNSKSARIGTAHRRDLYDNVDNAPGPGSYNHSRQQSSGPRWKFGNDKKKSLYENQDNPGPGTYNNGFGIDFNAGFTLISRRPDTSLLEPSKVPGPGSYNHLINAGKTAPSYKFHPV